MSWQRIDVNLTISLFEYGFIARRKGREWQVVVRIDNDAFDIFFLTTRELNELVQGKRWAGAYDIICFLDYVGMTKRDWLRLPFVHKLSDCLNYWGVLNILGDARIKSFNGLGICISTKYGDGTYPVIGFFEKGSTVPSAVLIDFDPEEE